MRTDSAPDSTNNHEDGTGRSRLLWNVLASWGAHLVFIVAGFVLPRVIDRNLGQEALGIWDFGWSITTYLSLTQLGVGSAVNRHVAMYRATNDQVRLNGAVSSVVCIQLAAALVALAITLLTAFFLSSMFSSRLGHLVEEARWVTLLLGVSLAVQMACDSFAGVMTGCHRWDIHNGLNAGFYGMTVVAMLLALFGGGGLRTLACITLVTRVLAEGTRIFLTHRLCPELRVRWQYANRLQMREMLTFGSKNVIGEISMLFLYQTTNLLIVSYLGAASLALYARSMALVQHSGVFVGKFASVLTPTVGSLHAGGREEELRGFFLQATEAGMCLALPFVVLLAVLGNLLLQLWMGVQYVNGHLLTLLAVGHLMTMNQSSIWTILRGIDKHGRVAMVRLVSAFCAACFAFFALQHFEQDLHVVALAVTIPITLVDGFYSPLYACRQLGVPFRHYARRTWGRPLLCVLPFAGCLFVTRLIFLGQPVVTLLVGGVIGGAALGFSYWRWVLPSAIRKKMRQQMAAYF